MENDELKKGVEAFLASMADGISEFLRKISGSAPVSRQKILAEFAAGDLVTIGGTEFVVLEQRDGDTVLLTKECIGEETAFGENNNNYAESIVDDICESFAELLEDSVGEENLVEFDVDLTSDDGLKDYGQIRRKCALITADMYRRYVDILDLHNPKKYWWFATPHSTKRHENDSWVKCVSPSGRIGLGYYRGDRGVRPFCILKSDIFVSC